MPYKESKTHTDGQRTVILEHLDHGVLMRVQGQISKSELITFLTHEELNALGLSIVSTEQRENHDKV